jgi:hypothetical protein
MESGAQKEQSLEVGISDRGVSILRLHSIRPQSYEKHGAVLMQVRLY